MFIISKFKNLLYKKNTNLRIIIPFVIYFISPLLLLFTESDIINQKTRTKIFDLHQSKKVQDENYTISVYPISRKNGILLKLDLLANLPESKKDIILFSNHQLQYIFEGKNHPDLFNIWMGNLSITEIADVIAYNYKFKKSALPSKLLVSMITSPNNDCGQSIIGYQNELPDQIVGAAKIKSNKIELSRFGEFISNSKFMRNLKFKADYKYIFPFIKKPKVTILKDKIAAGEFNIDLNGSSKGYQAVPPYPLKLNEVKKQFFFETPFLNKKDVPEIISSLKSIDEIAYNLGIEHVLIIPPVFETDDKYRMESNVNKILDMSLDIFKKNSKASTIIDDRRNKKYLNSNASKYYFHYDHPSPEYGKDIYLKLKEILKN